MYGGCFYNSRKVKRKDRIGQQGFTIPSLAILCQASTSRFFIEISVGRARVEPLFCLKTPQSDPPQGSDLKGSSNGLVFLEWLKGQLCVCCNSFHLTLIQSIQPLSKEDNATATFIIQCQITDPACLATCAPNFFSSKIDLVYD